MHTSLREALSILLEVACHSKNSYSLNTISFPLLSRMPPEAGIACEAAAETYALAERWTATLVGGARNHCAVGDESCLQRYMTPHSHHL